MAIQLRGKVYRILFRHDGKQHAFPIGPVAEKEALAKSAQVDYLLLRLTQRLIELPPGIGIVEFVRFDGKPPVTNPVTKLTLGQLRDQFLAARAPGREANTQLTTAIHFRHLARSFGEAFALVSLAQTDLQRYIRERPVSATTIRKEITTLRTAWHWAVDSGLLTGNFPNKGLIYPKEDEQPPYRTREEITRLAKGMTEAEGDPLWEALYLRPAEVADLLEHARTHARHPWIYPLICCAAHTGARRSELIRAAVADVDFEGGVITIQEKKRLKGKRSTRRAPLTAQLAEALREWLLIHPGGKPLFCHAGEVNQSRKRSATTGHTSKNRPTTTKGRAEAIQLRKEVPVSFLTPSEVHDHVSRTLADSAWAVVKGLHTLRHSFISGLAAAGVDQRIIDDIVGHTSTEMQRRYRHLVPQLKSESVRAVFGAATAHAGETGAAPRD